MKKSIIPHPKVLMFSIVRLVLITLIRRRGVIRADTRLRVQLGYRKWIMGWGLEIGFGFVSRLGELVWWEGVHRLK
jgi:hypothetical protein